jgi:hypothetical protein
MVHFKGGGFYKNDSSKSTAPVTKPATPAEAKTAAPALTPVAASPAPSTPATKKT